MSTFIKLHGFHEGLGIIVNAKYIHTIIWNKKGYSDVCLLGYQGDESLVISETPEEIMELINKAMFNGFSSSTVGTGKIRIVKYSKANK